MIDATEFLEKVKDVIGCEDDMVLGQSMETIAEWDSLGLLGVLDLLEEEGIELEMDELEDVKTTDELINLVNKNASA